jgi:hypothetical protein
MAHRRSLGFARDDKKERVVEGRGLVEQFEMPDAKPRAQIEMEA